MRSEFDDTRATPVWLLVASAFAMTTALYLMFVWVSNEVTMGIIQRIFYFHVPAASPHFSQVVR